MNSIDNHPPAHKACKITEALSAVALLAMTLCARSNSQMVVSRRSAGRSGVSTLTSTWAHIHALMGRARLVNVPLRASTTRHVYATIVSGGISRVARRGFAAPAEKRPKRQPHPAPGSRLAELMSDHELYGKNTKPRYPIVLCHGLFGFDVRGPFWGMEFHYWSTTLEVLRKHAKADVYVFAVPPTGSIAERAESLHNFLCDPKNGLKGQKINFIGHSMGGLDVRHLITTIRPDPSDYIPVSLTTLATPHRGSPVMDWFSANIGVGVELRDDLLRKAGHVSSLDWAQQPLSLKSPILKRRRNTDAGSNMNSIQGSSMLRMFESISNAFSSYMLSRLTSRLTRCCQLLT